MLQNQYTLYAHQCHLCIIRYHKNTFSEGAKIAK